MPAVTVKDINPHEFVKAYAAHLKRTGKLEVPKWADLVKTSTSKELAPYDPDWFYIRSASVARRIYIRSPVGVNTLNKMYGTRGRRGTCPAHFAPASSSISRKILQALEKIGVVDQDESGGRRITQVGQRDLDRIAGQIVSRK